VIVQFIRVGILLLMLGCAGPPEIQLVRYPGVPAPERKLADCQDVRIARRPHEIAGCVQFADIFLGEAGSTSPCDQGTMYEYLREQACLAGADVAFILRVSPPRGGSSCYQVRAGLLACPSGG
jgi:hypothetical protein